jgi:glycosyltransferase involved in cell wall biosynthesis
MGSGRRVRRMLALTLLGAVVAPSRSRKDAGQADARDRDQPRTDGEVGPGRPDRRLRVLVLGLRGFPNVEGGVEAHAQNLYPRLVQLGCDVEVVVRSPYVAKDSPRSWRGVRFRRVWAPKVQGHEAAVHSLLAVLLAGARRPDVVHIHAIGSAMWAPLARLLGLKVVVTHHSLNYEHEKWGRGARALLRFGEFAGMRFSHGRIAIARPIAELMPERHGVSVRFIPNGVELPRLDGASDAIKPFGLERGRYLLCVGRLTPEKRQHDLIEAFAGAGLNGWKLVLVGADGKDDRYASEVVEQAERTPGVICTGFQTGETLRQLYAHAGGFVLPSGHEGLSIALLEAISFGLPVVVTDIPGNRAIGLTPNSYVPMGDVPALTERIREMAATPITAHDRERRRAFVAKHFDWDEAAVDTLDTYRQVLAGRPALRLVPEQAQVA